MIFIKPYEVDDSSLISSNIMENEYPTWSANIAYFKGDIVIYISNDFHKVYECLDPMNIAITPRFYPDSWLDLGANNRWNMFDKSVQSQSSNFETINVTIKPDQRVDSVVLLNISAYQVQIKMTDITDGLVYDKTTILISNSGIDDWFSYFYEPVIRVSDFIANDLPPYYNATINIILTDIGNTVYCGGIKVGKQVLIGNTQYGSNVGIQDYSLKTQDAFGNYSILERAFRKTGSFQVQLDINQTDNMMSLLASLRSVPIIYSGSNDFSSMIIYGFYKDLSMNISYPEISQCTLTIEGLT